MICYLSILAWIPQNSKEKQNIHKNLLFSFPCLSCPLLCLSCPLLCPRWPLCPWKKACSSGILSESRLQKALIMSEKVKGINMERPRDLSNPPAPDVFARLANERDQRRRQEWKEKDKVNDLWSHGLHRSEILSSLVSSPMFPVRSAALTVLSHSRYPPFLSTVTVSSSFEITT